MAEKVFLLDGTQIAHLPSRAVVQRVRRSFALRAGGLNEFEFTLGRVEALVIPRVGVGRLYGGIA